MRMPCVRFTVGHLMLAVAVFSFSLHLGLSYRRSGDYMRVARFYARAGEGAVVRARNVESGEALLDGYTSAEKRRVVDQARKFAVHAARMEVKYERAALLPWLLVVPDQPAPWSASLGL